MDARAWSELIAEKLTEPDASRLNTIRDSLIERNWQAGGHQHGFLFGGKYFTNLPPTQQFAAPKKVAEASIIPEAQQFINEAKLHDREKLHIKQGLMPLLTACISDQDVRDALPESIVKLFPDLVKFPRTRPEAWPIKDSPLQMFAWEHVEASILMHVSNRLIY